jgi:hypothetical protein
MAGRYTNATPGGWFPAARGFLISCGRKERAEPVSRDRRMAAYGEDNALQGPGSLAAAEGRVTGFNNQAEPRSLSVVAPRC